MVGLLKSKRFWAVALELVFMVIATINPTLSDSADTLIPASLVLISVLVGGFTMRDPGTNL